MSTKQTKKAGKNVIDNMTTPSRKEIEEAVESGNETHNPITGEHIKVLKDLAKAVLDGRIGELMSEEIDWDSIEQDLVPMLDLNIHGHINSKIKSERKPVVSRIGKKCAEKISKATVAYLKEVIHIPAKKEMSREKLQKLIEDVVNKGLMDGKDTQQIINDQVDAILSPQKCSGTGTLPKQLGLTVEEIKNIVMESQGVTIFDYTAKIIAQAILTALKGEKWNKMK